MVQGNYRYISIYFVRVFFIFMTVLFSLNSTVRDTKSTLSKSCEPGRIIFITGSCSAGKSSMARIIAHNLGAKSFAFDEYVMPIVLKSFIAKHYGRFVAKLVTGIIGCNFFSSVTLLSEKRRYKFQMKFLADLKAGLATEPTTRMYNAVKKAAMQGHDVVVESPLFLFDGVTCLESLKVFDDMNITYVLAYCPWGNVIERMERRNSSPNKKNHRELDWVLGNYVQYVLPSLDPYDENYLESVDGDYVHKVVAEYAQQRYKKKRMKLLPETQKAVLNTFPTQARYYVYPRFKYDIIVNTQTHDPAQGAAVALHYKSQ